jgi:hypothetical protein
MIHKKLVVQCISVLLLDKKKKLKDVYLLSIVHKLLKLRIMQWVLFLILHKQQHLLKVIIAHHC